MARKPSECASDGVTGFALSHSLSQGSCSPWLAVGHGPLIITPGRTRRPRPPRSCLVAIIRSRGASVPAERFIDKDEYRNPCHVLHCLPSVVFVMQQDGHRNVLAQITRPFFDDSQKASILPWWLSEFLRRNPTQLKIGTMSQGVRLTATAAQPQDRRRRIGCVLRDRAALFFFQCFITCTPPGRQNPGGSEAPFSSQGTDSSLVPSLRGCYSAPPYLDKMLASAEKSDRPTWLLYTKLSTQATVTASFSTSFSSRFSSFWKLHRMSNSPTLGLS